MHAFASFVMFLGRIAIAPVFLYQAFYHIVYYQSMIQQLHDKQVPFSFLIFFIAVVIELLGGLFLFLGKNSRFWAMILAIYLVPTTYLLYNFWDYSQEAMHIQLNLFMKNCALFGGLLYILATGPGTLSIDCTRRKRKERENAAREASKRQSPNQG